MYWGIHNVIHVTMEHSHYIGRPLTFEGVYYDERLSPGDVAFLFRWDDYLYGWGTVQSVGDPRVTPSGILHDVTVIPVVLRSNLASVATDIKGSPTFSNYDRLKEINLSSFNDEQALLLGQLCARDGAAPPSPSQMRAKAMPSSRPRPVQTDFRIGRKLAIEETRFDEFKEVTTANAVSKVKADVDQYAIGFLNLEDRRDVDYCRIFWGISDVNRHVVGVQLDDSQRDELRRVVSGKLAGIQPPLPASGYYIEIHPVIDDDGASIPNLYVVEVGLGPNRTTDFYCSQDGSFYIKHDATCPRLAGQQLLAEIKRRVRHEIESALARGSR